MEQPLRVDLPHDAWREEEAPPLRRDCRETMPAS
jgi:hypothetical protein